MIKEADGTVSASFFSRFAHQITTWKEAWGVGREAPLTLSGEDSILVPAGPGVDELRSLARSFKTATISIDGFHPRHFAVLGDGALRVQSGVFTAMNVLGNAPLSLRQLIVALYRKPLEGRRLIGFYQSTTRLYSKSLANACRRWESLCAASPFFVQHGPA